MELNLSELTLTKFTAVNNLVAMVTMEHTHTHNPNAQFNKDYLINMNLNNFKLIEAMGLKIIVSRST
jgi:hypothetical protein